MRNNRGMAPRDIIDLDVTDVAHGGVFVGRHEGRVVFVPDALPGERVRVRLTDTAKSSFWRGEVLEVRDASPHRRPHVWRAADLDTSPEARPGGADFGHIALAEQRRLKQHVLEDALQRFGGVEVSVPVVGASADADGRGETEDALGWRTRVSLHVDDEGRIGPFAARSHRVVTVDDLPLATPAVERAAARLQATSPGRIDLVQPADGRVRVLPRPGDVGGRHRGPRRGGARPPASDARHDKAREVVIERVDDREFRVDAGGFWQVHRLAAASLSRLVSEALADAVDPDAWHLDLYGGVGLFAATLATLGGTGTRVTSVESDARASEHAGTNLAEWIGSRVETGRVDRWLRDTASTASATERERLARGVVLLDPPRSGAGREVVRSIAQLEPERVAYVACDPVALARDVSTFRAEGYDLERIDAVDLFPHSHHVEALAVLRRVAPIGSAK